MADQEYSDAQAQRLALAAAKEAVRETMTEIFSLFGVSLANFESMEAFRKDLAFLRSMSTDAKPFREDMAFLRSLRLSAKKAGSRFALTVVSLIAGAFAIGMWEWLRDILQGLHK